MAPSGLNMKRAAASAPPRPIVLSQRFHHWKLIWVHCCEIVQIESLFAAVAPSSLSSLTISSWFNFPPQITDKTLTFNKRANWVKNWATCEPPAFWTINLSIRIPVFDVIVHQLVRSRWIHHVAPSIFHWPPSPALFTLKRVQVLPLDNLQGHGFSRFPIYQVKITRSAFRITLNVLPYLGNLENTLVSSREQPGQFPDNFTLGGNAPWTL